MSTDPRDADATGESARWQVLAALAVGAVLTLVGVLGFVLVPEEGRLFGVFGVNALHNAVHLLTGVAGLAAGFVAAGELSDEYNKVGGVAYLLLVALWVVVPGVLNAVLNIGLPDTLLHLGLGVVLGAVGFGAVDRLG
jgi:hypothetical protein